MDKAFIARKLRLACLALSHQAVFKTEYQLGLLDAVLKYLETSDLEETPTVGLYFHCYHFLSGLTPSPVPNWRGEQHFAHFKEMLFAHADIFPEDELRTLYLLAINFGIKKINEQQGIWLRNTLDLYQHALARQLLLENGHISRFAFNNIAGIALRLGELDWAEGFVQQHQHFLEKQHRRSTAAFNLARVAYARRDYGTALLHLQEAVDRDVFSNLQAKTVQLKIYYETNEWEALESHLASMKTYIRRHARIAYQRDNYLRILLYVKQLMQLDRAKPAAVAKLHEQIAAEQSLTEREWLMEQVGLG
jgi:tetratricopeptide (TPR) repeat protein